MKFFDTSGREHKIDLRPSKYPRKEIGEGRGKFQSEVGEILSEIYPLHHIFEEFSCPGERLFLDFFLPTKKLAIEVQGTQHEKFNAFFHEDKNAFARQQANDKRKERWCELNGIQLVKIKWGEKRENIIKALG